MIGNLTAVRQVWEIKKLEILLAQENRKFPNFLISCFF